MRKQWEKQVGADAVAELERTLQGLIGNNPVRLDPPGWLVHDLGGDS